MTVQETKDWLNELKGSEEILEFYYADNFKEALDMAIQALEEVEQYRALGTVEELKEAREKQVAKELNNKEIMETVNKIIRCLKKQKNSYFTDVVASTISMLEEFDEVQFEYWSEEDEDD